MAALTDYAESGFLNAMFRGNPNSFAFPTGIYIGLTSDSPTDADPTANEISGNGYARKQVVQDTGNWTAPVADTGGHTIDNTATIQFAQATGNWGYVSGVIIADSPTGGNVYMRGALTTAREVQSGDEFKFNIGELDIKFF